MILQVLFANMDLTHHILVHATITNLAFIVEDTGEGLRILSYTYLYAKYSFFVEQEHGHDWFSFSVSLPLTIHINAHTHTIHILRIAIK